MSVKDVLAVFYSARQDGIFAVARALRAHARVRLRALYVTQLPEPAAPTHGVDHWAELALQARQEADAGRAFLAAQLGDLGAELAHVELSSDAAATVVMRAALYSDLTLVERPHTDFARSLCRSILLHSGRPLIVTPPRWRGKALGRDVQVQWCDQPACARALSAAGFMLERSKTIAVRTRRPTAVAEDEAEIVLHLRRRALRASISIAAGALSDDPSDCAADLIVAGAGGDEAVLSRHAEMLLRHAPTPVLLSH